MEAYNKLGRIESEHLSTDADSFGKFNLFHFAVIFMACSNLPEVQYIIDAIRILYWLLCLLLQ